MATAKWIGGFLGFINGGVLGALAGYAIGWLFDLAVDGQQQGGFGGGNGFIGDGDEEQRVDEGQRNSFLFSLLVLSAYVIRVDGRVMHSEMEVVRRFLRQNFGEQAVAEGEQILLRLFQRQKEEGTAAYRGTIIQACREIAAHMDYSQRLLLVNYLTLIAQADGKVVADEVAAIKEVAYYMGVAAADVDAALNLRQGGSDLDAAYKVLGISPEATDDEVKAAYRKMALKHHPDRVAALGDDVRRAAEKKFQEINAAKELIFKARGL